jgi:hypothetical protein
MWSARLYVDQEWRFFHAISGRGVKHQSTAKPFNAATPLQRYSVAQMDVRVLPRRSQPGATHGMQDQGERRGASH